MKTALFILLISFAFSSAFLFRGSDNPVAIDEENAPSCIEAFLTAQFAHFGLKKPEQLLRCYNVASAALYFKHIDLVNDLVQHTERRESHLVHLDFVKILALDKALWPSSSCAAKTQDIQDLFNALGITDRNPELLGINAYIHYQANFGELAQQVPHILDALNAKDFAQAGELSGALLNNTVKEIQNQGTALLALKGLWNGVNIGLGLPDAESILGCWNNETAGIRLEFIYGLSLAVAQRNPLDAAYNTQKWYEEKGKDLVNKIPAETWKCWKDSTDVKRASEKLHIDINSPEFYDKAKKFVYGQQLVYWTIQKIIKENLEQHNFNHAGSAYGNLIEAIAKTN